MAYIGIKPTIGNFQICDDITVVNGQAAYTMQVGGANVIPETSNHCLVSLNGVLQKSGGTSPSFTVSGSTITFASNLATGDVIDFIHILGSVLDLGVPSDGTVTNAKLAQDIISGETELTSEPASTDEFLVSDAGTLKRIDYSLISNTPAFFAYDLHSVEQSLTGGTNTKLTPATEYFDTDSAYGSDKFTVPSGKGGKYRFYGGAEMKNNTGIGFCNLYVNGSTVLASGDFFTSLTSRYNGGTGGSTDEAFCPIDIILTLSAGDYVELYMQLYNSGDVRKIQFGGYKLTGI